MKKKHQILENENFRFSYDMKNEEVIFDAAAVVVITAWKMTFSLSFVLYES